MLAVIIKYFTILSASKNLGKSGTPKPTHNRGSKYDFLHPFQDDILTARCGLANVCSFGTFNPPGLLHPMATELPNSSWTLFSMFPLRKLEEAVGLG